MLSLLSKLDHHLVLTIDQREQFRDVLEEHWQDSWCNRRYLTQGTRRFPSLPEDKLVPLLTATQKRAWRAVYKQGGASVGLHFGLVQGVEIDLDDWEAE